MGRYVSEFGLWTFSNSSGVRGNRGRRSVRQLSDKIYGECSKWRGVRVTVTEPDPKVLESEFNEVLEDYQR